MGKDKNQNNGWKPVETPVEVKPVEEKPVETKPAETPAIKPPGKVVKRGGGHGPRG